MNKTKKPNSNLKQNGVYTYDFNVQENTKQNKIKTSKAKKDNVYAIQVQSAISKYLLTIDAYDYKKDFIYNNKDFENIKNKKDLNNNNLTQTQKQLWCLKNKTLLFNVNTLQKEVKQGLKNAIQTILLKNINVNTKQVKTIDKFVIDKDDAQKLTLATNLALSKDATTKYTYNVLKNALITSANVLYYRQVQPKTSTSKDKKTTSTKKVLSTKTNLKSVK